MIMSKILAFFVSMTLGANLFSAPKNNSNLLKNNYLNAENYQLEITSNKSFHPETIVSKNWFTTKKYQFMADVKSRKRRSVFDLLRWKLLCLANWTKCLTVIKLAIKSATSYQMNKDSIKKIGTWWKSLSPSEKVILEFESKKAGLMPKGK